MSLSCFAFTVLALSCLALPLKAQGGLPKNAETFEVDGNKAFVYAAPSPAEGKPWVWYAPTLKSLGPGERKSYYETFVKKGISIAGFDLGEARGAPASTAKFSLFYEAMVSRGYSPKPILLGQSRGGMMTLAWAFRNPDKVPMFAVHGDQDVAVPYDLNTKLLKERYEAGGGSIPVKVIPGKGHQVDPTFFACQELVDFVLEHAK